jgi:hypothetical protein
MVKECQCSKCIKQTEGIYIKLSEKEYRNDEIYHRGRKGSPGRPGRKGSPGSNKHFFSMILISIEYRCNVSNNKITFFSISLE